MTKNELCSETQKNRIVIHKDNNEKRIYENDLETYLINGWEKGISEKHRLNNSVAKKGKPSKMKGIPKSNQQKSKISKTLKTRYSNNEIQTWNKGLTKEDPRVAKNIDSRNATMIDRYGTLGTNNGKSFSEEHKAKISASKKGVPSPLKNTNRPDSVKNKISKSKLNHFVSEETKLKISNSKKGKRLPKDKLLIKATKQYITKKLNNSFNTSKPEQDLYEQLLKENINKTIYRNYRDKDRYPFYCDFYILEDDLFIELNAHWTHGGRPYDPNDPECQEQLAIWQEKAKTSQFYKNAIETWTIRDVEKQEMAKKNHINYRVIY